VKTTNRKFGVTYLLDIPELLQVVQDWDNEVRSILPPNGFWFALLSPTTGKIDPGNLSIGEHRATLAERNIKAWLLKNGLRYHSCHKFRHGFTQYCQAHAKSIADYKAISLNLLHSSMEITDQFYSNLNDGEVQNRISNLGKSDKEQDDFALFQKFLRWKEKLKES